MTDGVLSVDQVIRACSGRTVFLATFPGNNGDELIHQGVRELLSRSGLRATARAHEAGLILLAGGGMMFGPHGGREWLARTASKFRDTDLLLLPSSFASDSIGPALAERDAGTCVFARDEASYGALVGMGLPPRVRLGLDHDSSFALEGSAFIQQLRARSRAKHILIVERTDVEASTGHRDRWSFMERPAPRPLRLLPKPARSAARAALKVPRRLTLGAQLRANAATAYARRALERLRSERPSLSGAPVVALDIAQTSVCSFEAYCDYVAEAAVVVSNRLHVAILGALLGKPVYIDVSAAKLRDVFSYSLARYENVRPL